MTETIRIIYFGAGDLDYARVRAAVRGSRRAGITLYRVTDVRQAMANRLLHPQAICMVSPRMQPSALLQLLDWGQISGDVGPVYQLRHVVAGAATPARPRSLPLRGYVPTRDMTTRGLEQFIDKVQGRTFFGRQRKRSGVGALSLRFPA